MKKITFTIKNLEAFREKFNQAMEDYLNEYAEELAQSMRTYPPEKAETELERQINGLDLGFEDS